MQTPNQTLNNPLNEFIKCFDRYGNSIEPKLRQEIHKKPYSIWHGVTSVWILNSKGEILCSKRSDKVEGNPSKWQTYFGGHVKSGDNFLKTVVREVKEEIGLNISAKKFILVDSGKREDVMHFYKMYSILFDNDLSKLNFKDGEIVKVKWLSFKKYEKEKNKKPDSWCNSMKPDQYQKAITALKIKLKP